MASGAQHAQRLRAHQPIKQLYSQRAILAPVSIEATLAVDKGQVESTEGQPDVSTSVLNLLQNAGLGDLSQFLSTQVYTPLVGEEGLEPPTSTV